MSQSLTDVAKQLKKSNKKVQLIYAFNGTGKTRLSREFKELIVPKILDEDDEEQIELARTKILYYNAFTEDLFYWDNDLVSDAKPKLKVQSNDYTHWLMTLLKELGEDGNIIKYFQRYANDKLTPRFNEEYISKDKDGHDVIIKAFSEITFSLERGDDDHLGNLKISKGEESNFIWSVFYTLLDQVISVLNVLELTDRLTNEFNKLEYIFIDDPVSSLDENHLIELAVNLATLIKSSDFTNGKGLKFIISTHNPLFYNVLHNELGLSKSGKKEGCYLLEGFEDGGFNLNVKYGDSNRSFSYHLHLRQLLEDAIAKEEVQRYHFILLRNLYEKTASFLGYKEWSELLPGEKKVYLNRIIQFTSHSTLSNETVTQPSDPEKQTVKFLLKHLIDNYGFYQQEEQNG